MVLERNDTNVNSLFMCVFRKYNNIFVSPKQREQWNKQAVENHSPTVLLNPNGELTAVSWNVSPSTGH